MPQTLDYVPKTPRKRGKRTYFWRATRYLRPYKKIVIVSIICAFFAGGIFFSGLGALLPVLQTLLNGDSPQMWADRMVAEKRWDIDLVDDPNEVRLAAPLISPTYTDLFERFQGETSDLSPAEQLQVLVEDDEALDRTGDIRVYPFEVPWHLRLLRRVVYLLPSNPVGAVAAIMCVVFLLSMLANSIRFVQEYLSNTAALSAVNDVRRDLYSHALRSPLGYFGKTGTGDITSRIINDAGQLQEGLRTLLGRAVQEPIFAFFALIFALWIDWRLTLFIIAFAPIMAVILKKFGTKMRRASRSTLQSSSELLGQIESTLAGVRVVKANNAEAFEVGRLRGILQRLLGDQLKVAKYDALSSPVLESMAMLAVGVIFVVAVYLVRVDGSLSAAGALMIFAALIQIAESVRRVTKLNVILQRANAAGERIFEAIDAPQEDSPRSTRTTTEKEIHNLTSVPLLALRVEFSDSIAFENVTFAYSPEQPAALDGVSLAVKKGESIAVVGRNGSGKTTLLSLLPRFYEPDAGRVTIDGVDVKEWPLDQLRELIGVVTQEAIVFPGTIAQNIAYARPGSSRETIEAAAKQAEAHGFILDKPLGYDTPLIGLGGSLSGGQRQRLNIARAILRDPPILILDEATSQVDAESEHLIQNAISHLMKGRTTFVIAHRFSTILNCDRIVLMEAGRIQALGTHEELLETDEVYRALYDRQLVGAG